MTRSIGIEARHKVLLVDDDAVSLEIMALLLVHEGHQVLSAQDAGAALALLASEQSPRPDVLLVDLQMPGVSGSQLAEKVRALEGPGPLLLAMSATAVQDQQLLAFDGFLLKPIAVKDFREALEPQKKVRPPAARISRPLKTAAVPASTEAVDAAVVQKLLRMMPVEALHDVFAACIADTRTSIDVLKKQVQQRDQTGVRETAHRIKGAAAMVGAVRLARLAAGIEMGVSKQAATPRVLEDLLAACSELERMLLAGKITNTRAPHDHIDHYRHT